MISLGVYALQVGANPSQISETKTSSATSTPTYLAASTALATTTLAIDTQGDGGASMDSGKLAIQFTASSTATQLKWKYEYANTTVINGQVVDCSVLAIGGQCDWYSESVNSAGTTATTTVEVQNFKEYSWIFASTTQGAIAVTGSTTRALKIIDFPTPTRYARVVFYLPVGSPGAAVWADIVTKREQR